MMNKNLLLAIFGNVAPQGKIIKYMSSEAVSGGWVDNNTDTSRNTFINGEGTLYLNDGVINIGGSNSTDKSPFYSVSTVTSIDLKYSGLVYINSGAFFDCNSLISVIIPDSVTTIGKNAFKGCSSLVSITIPDSVTSIGNYAFSDCSGLTSIIIGNSVTNINNGAFYYCYSLTSIVVNSENSIYDSRNNCNAIIETATKTLIVGCKNTIIPDSVTSIGNDAFHGCSGLTTITIPDSVTSIGRSAFDSCTSLTSITIPYSVNNISNSVFFNCMNLEFITIPDSVTTIGSKAFVHCHSLTSITIPDSVTSIGNDAFQYCDNLTSVTCLATNPPTLGTNNFTAENDKLYVPAESVETYKATNWKDAFSSILPIS